MPEVFPGLRESLQSLDRDDTVHQCKLGKWVASLSKEEREEVEQVFNTLDLNVSKFTLILRPYFEVSRFSVDQHWKKTCRCYR